jgi:hypothetical protein
MKPIKQIAKGLTVIAAGIYSCHSALKGYVLEDYSVLFIGWLYLT